MKTYSSFEAGSAFVLLGLVLLWSSTVDAQCNGGNLNPNIVPSAPMSEFSELDDGTLLHRRTRLVWARCALGQSWDGVTCTGSASQLTWSAALVAAEGHSQANMADWRLPNRNELASIIERRCFSPALDAEAFPAAPAEGFWSSTPVSGGGEMVWGVGTMDGVVGPVDTDSLQAVRLVRGGRD